MANSSVVSAGDDILASQYNNLRKDVLDLTLGHTHDETDSRKLATLNPDTGHFHNGSDSKYIYWPWIQNKNVVNGEVNANANIEESKLAFNTTTGHDHDGTNSKALASGLYGARAYADTIQDIASSTYTKIVFANESYDIANEFADSRYTATTSGYYIINCCLAILPTGGAGWNELNIYKNNTLYSESRLYPTYDNVHVSIKHCDIIQLAVNDYIEIYGIGDYGFSVGHASTYFTIMKIKSVA